MNLKGNLTSKGLQGSIGKSRMQGILGTNPAAIPISVDNALSLSSTNPVQNRVITAAIINRLWSDEVKTALLQIVEKVAFIDEHGQDYYDALYDALYPPTNLDSIGAVFDSSATIYNTDTLDDLKQYLTVTAYYTDGTSETVTTYTLSGSMDAGTQTITVTYGGKSAIFTVTVVEWLTSISAVFTQGSATIYDTDSLDTLKQYLVVTATYADSTTATVSEYTLSGTLTEGTSTITASYGGKTDTFSVTVTHTINSWLYHFNQSILSSGSHDFGFSGTANYADGVNIGDKCYYHHVVTEGDSTTDPLGLYAINTADYPIWENNDFTIACWWKGDTANRGYIFTACKAAAASGSLSWNSATIGNVASGWTVTKVNAQKYYAGIRFGFSSLTLYLSLTNEGLTNGSGFKATPPESFDSTVWHHYAITREGATIYVFIDGSIVFTITLSTTAAIYSSNCIAIGNFMSNSTTPSVEPAPFSSYHQDLFVSNKVAKWTAGFDPTDIVY